MNRFRSRKRIATAVALSAAAMAVAGAASAQVGGAYDLSWNTMDPGGAIGVAGGAYSLGGTVAQIDAGVHSGGAYLLTGGFWWGAIDPVTGVDPGIGPEGTPPVLALHSPVPNPFDRETRIAFDLPHATRASARVYDVSGALVRTLLDEPIAAGRHEIVWPGTNDEGRRVAQGVYLLRLEVGRAMETRKLVLTR
jgi:hypothetical protein